MKTLFQKLDSILKLPLIIALFFLFGISRVFIFQNPPEHYSDVTADYERYANMWRYGLPPYTQHLYEYPPATIPLLAMPLNLDQAGIGKYYPNYRTQILIIDGLFFVFLVLSLRKLWKNKVWKESGWHWGQAVTLYILLTTLGKDFLYEGIDLAFTSSMSASILVLIWFDKWPLLRHYLSWVFFWLSTAIKFLTAPLAPILAFALNRKNAFLSGFLSFLGFLTVWGYPLLKWRSSLLVSFYWNFSRPIKYAAFPTQIIRWYDVFTHTESQLLVAPDFPYQGLISDNVTQILSIVFPLVLGLVLLYLVKQVMVKKSEIMYVWSIPSWLKVFSGEIFKPVQLSQSSQIILLTQAYGLLIFTLFLSAKTFSQPFHIWYFAPAVFFPWRKKQLVWVAGSATLMILLDMTTVLHVNPQLDQFYNFPFTLIRDIFRFAPMMVIWRMFYQRGNELILDKKTS